MMPNVVHELALSTHVQLPPLSLPQRPRRNEQSKQLCAYMGSDTVDLHYQKQ